jgi:hypothetical protein
VITFNVFIKVKNGTTIYHLAIIGIPERLTLDGWHMGHDDEGWKAADQVFQETWADGEETGRDQGLNGPGKVRAKPRLLSDLRAMEKLFSAEIDPKYQKRSKHPLVKVYYGLVDASQDRFGFNIQIGQWCNKISNKSSN